MEDDRDPPADDVTGLPGARSWRTVYLWVFGTFVLWIVLLTILTRHYT